MPSRRIGPKKGVNRRCLVSHNSDADAMSFGESLLERDFIKFCNCIPNVMKVEYQPRCLAYNYNGKRRRYFPDFLISTRDGNKILVEVKPSNRLDDEENLIKFKVGEMFCEQKGWTFKVISDSDLYRGHLKHNVNLLLEVQRINIETEDLFIIYQMIQNFGPLRIKDLHNAFSELDTGVINASVYKLLLNQLCKTDLINQLLTEVSIIEVNEKKEW
ncbi:TnsA endonuclease N-terminal domain-containing protein [Bacillus sp. 3255]|uniref:TnsA endonuclease N-terminal domain-containing protein n=1 Tax=Bacillus sp. 3255 TaxID=2817904 RepID=UPI002862F161|nr:TnsA endonuclease N-terminal domain-containing protein [Bacillus sp. 3255]MDR6885416.1 hypothetical protein [Bacillus sp. 3255]